VNRFIGSHLVAMLVLTTLTFSVGVAQKAPCMTRHWVEERTGISFRCDTDIPNLYAWEQLAGGRLPYLDPCISAVHECDEYPVGTMYLMRAVAWSIGSGGDPYARFSWLATWLLLVCALWITWCLERMGARTLMFAAAPVLLTAGTLNWDLVPVSLATAATLAFLRRRDVRAGGLLGLGAIVKLYPALLTIPFALDRLRAGAREGAAKLSGTVVATWIAGNLPFASLGFAAWATFFRYNSKRPPDFDSLWEVACNLHLCPPTVAVNVASFALAGLGTCLAWRAARRHATQLPVWMLAFPLLVMVILTGKVWSSQYSLWLLPWFALTSVPWLAFFEYQLAETAEYLTRYLYFSTVVSGRGLSYWGLGVIVLIRAALLIRCLLLWIRRPNPVIDMASIGVAGGEPTD
jgi:hypothetical protein